MKKKLLTSAVTIIFMVQSISILKAQQWNLKTATFPSCYTQSNGFLVINNKAYIGVGTDNCYDWWEFDPDNNTSIQKASFTDTAGANATCFSINGFGYLMSQRGKMYKYDPVADSWTQKASFPINFPNADSVIFTGLNCSFVVNGKAYVAGLQVNNISYSREVFDLFEYDPTNDSWLNKGAIPDSAFGYVGFTINNLGYILGSDRFNHPPNYPYNALPPYTGNTLYEYNPLNNSWVKKNTCPIFKLASRGFVIGTKYYYGTGLHYDLTTGAMYNYDAFYSYDQLSDSWQHLAPLPDSSEWDEGIGFAINGKGYLGLGDCWSNTGNGVPPVSCTSGFYRGIWEYDPTASGIEETLTNSVVSIYPNPGSGKFLLQVENSQTKKLKLEVYNTIGERILQQNIINEIDLSDSPKGIYFVKISGGSEIFTKRIIIQ